MNGRPFLISFLSSAILHGVACCFLASAWVWPVADPRREEPIFVSCMAPPETPPIVETRREVSPVKSVMPVPVPALSAEEIKKPASVPRSIFSRGRSSEVSTRAKAAHIRRANILAPKTSSEFLADPQKGKVFVGYFAVVKDGIHHTLRKGYERKSGGEGTVSLQFVLNSDGTIAKALVVEKESSANENLKRFALNCLQRSAPFGTFPKELNSPQIAFTVTVFFDEI